MTEYRASFDAAITFSNGGDLTVHGFKVDVPSAGMVGNTGTYLDAPYHRFADGADVSAVPLARVVGLPAVVIRVAGTSKRGIGTGSLAAVDVRGKAVPLRIAGLGTVSVPAFAHVPG